MFVYHQTRQHKKRAHVGKICEKEGYDIVCQETSSALGFEPVQHDETRCPRSTV